MRILFSALLSSLLLFAACNKNKASTPDMPALFTLSATATPAADSSGIVQFVASANGANSYYFDFGNGDGQASADGKVTYTYPNSGTYTVSAIARTAGGQSATKLLPVTVGVARKLLWSDEFSVDGAPDAAKWGFDLGNGSNGWGNSELEYYTDRPENVTISGGILKIWARREAYNGSPFTSARLLTKDKFSTRYGRIEARLKLPAAIGTWPAFWMLGSNIDAVGWPACGEVDIMEYRGSEAGKIFGTLHYPGRSGGNANGTTTSIPNVTSDFHLYAVDWTPAMFSFSVDGKAFFEVANTRDLPFNKPFFIILNLAMGGNFAGAVDAGFNQAAMEVDYVRVYN